MTIANDILLDSLDRVYETVHHVVSGLGPDELAERLGENSSASTNSIAWLVWHLARVQDDHIASAAGTGQLWATDGWEKRFGLPFETEATGYGQTSVEVSAVRVESGDLLTGYFDAVHERTIAYVRTLTEGDLAAVVDTSWEPPVTLAARLVSVINDCTQHVGQAAFLRGIVRSRA
ncbi:MAG: DUF664 domain-containing protein [Burkholderiaceae bacterium]|nr:DUF664 domain-containing protein [Microbacteriaceae bacterium]